MNQAVRMSARDICLTAIKGNNFMTPDIIGYEKVSDNMAVEISEGRGMKGERIFGVTVASAEERGGRIECMPRKELNKLCWSRQEAEDYIGQLGGE